MPPLVVGGVVRYSVVQSMAGQEIVNIIDMHLDLGLGEDRAEEAFSMAGDLINNWDDHILPFQVNNLRAIRVDWLDLNSLDGSNGSRSSTSDTTWPRNGDGLVDAAPSCIAMRVDKIAPGPRGKRPGRMYLAGIAENWTSDEDPNRFQTINVTGMQDQLDDFLDGINDTDGVPGTRKMCVVRKIAGQPARAEDVTALVVRDKVATQVRRLR